MIPHAWREGEVAVMGLGRTGRAAASWLAGRGVAVYASDIGDDAHLRVAASLLRSKSVEVDLGSHDVRRIAAARAVVVSPGVPPAAPALAAARAAGVEILAEMDLAARALTAARLIVITGTNGKTTTTALTERILTEGGLDVEVGGNIGRPLIDIATLPRTPAWIVVEASSFQLHDSPHLAPAIGVLTNLAPDHLNRYDSVESYYADKRLLFRNACDASCWVLNADDDEVTALADDVPGRRRHWSLRAPSDAWYDRTADQLRLGEDAVLPRADLPLLGDHNVANALAAALIAAEVGVDRDAIGRGLRGVESLPNRLELVRSLDGVRWINDSKATNVASALVAVRAMTGSFLLLAGGRPKGEDFAPLAEALTTHCRHAYVFGEAGDALGSVLTDVPFDRVVDLHEAVRGARQLAQPGDVVLLSPACASFDQFRDYEERGSAFRDAVEDL